MICARGAPTVGRSTLWATHGVSEVGPMWGAALVPREPPRQTAHHNVLDAHPGFQPARFALQGP